MIAIVPLVFALVGVLMYALCSSSKLQEIGRLLFFAGVLVMCFALAHHSVRVFPSQ
jgi:Na+/phosphate symporter